MVTCISIQTANAIFRQRNELHKDASNGLKGVAPKTEKGREYRIFLHQSQ